MRSGFSKSAASDGLISATNRGSVRGSVAMKCRIDREVVDSPRGTFRRRGRCRRISPYEDLPALRDEPGEVQLPCRAPSDRNRRQSPGSPANRTWR